MDYIHNIVNNYNFLRQDYIGIHLNISIFYNPVINLLISLGLIVIFYLLGSKIKPILIKKENYSAQDIFIKIALGYIFVGTGLALLGLFSFLYSSVIILYLIAIVLLSIFPLRLLKKNIRELNKLKKQLLDDFKTHRWIFIWITLFIFIGFLKLQSPEIREDQYHTDLPVQYLKNHSIMLPSKQQIFVSSSPQLAEMTYLIPIFLGLKEATRYIHFAFYILILLFFYSISKDKEYEFTIFAPLIFITAPEVIHEFSSQYVDFQWILLFLLSLFIIIKSKTLSTDKILLSGILAGGMIATKLYTIVFPIPMIIYLVITLQKNNSKLFKLISIFVISSFFISSIWFFRSLILTGNPVYPAFVHEKNLEGVSIQTDFFHYLKLNSLFYTFDILRVFSPLFFIGLFLSIYKIKDAIIILRKLKLSIFFIPFTIEHLLINYSFGRYLFGLYSVAVIIVSTHLYKILNKNLMLKIIFSSVIFIIFIYYFVNTLLILPYGLGLADKNKYLTRVLSKDNSSYYDFDHKFERFLSNKDLVATYGIYGFYYANFDYIYTDYVFYQTKSFTALKNGGVTKLFIKGGDMDWFCNKIKLTDCKRNKYKLLASYSAVPHSANKYYLYSIIEYEKK